MPFVDHHLDRVLERLLASVDRFWEDPPLLSSVHDSFEEIEMRKSLPLALLLSTSLATAVLAAPQPTKSAFLRSLAPPTSCSIALPAPISGLLVPTPQERTGGCAQHDCSSDQDCPCGNGYGICGINNNCYYPPSGSGGGGGGSLGCPQAD